MNLADEPLIAFLKDAKYGKKDLANYQEYLNKAQGGLSGFSSAIKKAKGVLKSFGATMASMAINWAIGELIGLAIEAIDEHINANEKYLEQQKEIISKGKEAQETIASIKSDFTFLSSTVNDTKHRFAELAQGINQISGDNLRLSTEDYEEFLKLSNQIADLFPTLPRIFDENGNAIVQLSGDVDTIVNSLDSLVNIQRELANQEIADNLPEVYEGIQATNEKYEAQLNSIEEEIDQYTTMLNKLHSISSVSDLQDEQHLAKAPESARILQVLWDDMESFDEKTLDGAISYYTRKLHEVQSESSHISGIIKDNWSSLNTSLYSWLYTIPEYSSMGNDIQGYIQAMINSIDWDELNYDNDEQIKSYIYKNIIEPLTDNPDILNAFTELFRLAPGDLNRINVAEQLQTMLNKLDINFNVMPIVADEEKSKNRLENSLNDIIGYTYDWNAGYNQIAYNKLTDYTKDFSTEQIELWLEVTKGAASAEEAIQAYEDAITNRNDDTASLFDLDFTKSAESIDN